MRSFAVSLTSSSSSSGHIIPVGKRVDLRFLEEKKKEGGGG